MPAVTKKAAIATPTKGQQQFAAGKVDPAQALKAFAALADHTQKLATQRQADATAKNVLPLDGPQGDLKDRNNVVFMNIAVKQLNPESKVTPVRIPVPHAVHQPGQISACLLVKDPQRQYKDLLVNEKITSVSRVVGVTKLKGKFKSFDARRDLVQDHDLFLADARIVPLVPKICGKVFFDAKKYPVTVNVVRTRHLKEELNSAISSAYFLQNKGSNAAIKLGYLSSHTPDQLRDNLLAAIPAVISKIPGGWNNVQNIDVKTGSSQSLPIWNCSLGLKDVVKVDKRAETTEKEGKKKAIVKAAEAAVSPGSLKKKAADGVKSPKQVQAQAAKEDAALEVEISDENGEDDEEADKSIEKPKRPSPRKTRSASAKQIGKAKVEAPVKKTKAAHKAAASPASAGKKATSSTTRAATGRGKAKK